jgi:hypothetical protein
MGMKFKWQNILIALGLIVALILLIDFNHRMEELNRLTDKLESVRAEGTAVMRTQEMLLTQVAYATSDDAVEQWAYESKWVRVGEHPVELLPSGSVTATPEPVPVAQTQSLPKWQIWWELFFGVN